MRFLFGWDVKLIKMLKVCFSEKLFLSVYFFVYRFFRELFGDILSCLELSQFGDFGILILKVIGDLSKCSIL